MATVVLKNEFVLCLDNFVFISTITDLKEKDMLKIDVKPGLYKLIPFHDGYVLTEENYVPKLKDIVKIFRTRSADKGLSGTYYGGESKDVNQLRLFNKYIKPHLPEIEGFWWNETFYGTDESDEYYDLEEEEISIERENCDETDESDSEGEEIPVVRETFDETDESYGSDEEEIPVKRVKRVHRKNLDLKKIPECHNLPVIFFLNKPPGSLDGFDLEMSGKLNEDIIVWKVKDGADFIGYAVQSKCLVSMMGDQAGIAVLSNARAFGNFEWYKPNDPEYQENKDFFEESPVFDVDQPYECPFKPCSCSVNYYDYDKEKERKARLEMEAKYKNERWESMWDDKDMYYY